MKKLSDFKENKIALKAVSGGKKTFSFDAINAYPGGDSTPGNYIATIGTDFNGSWTWTDYEPLDYSITPRFIP